MLQQNIDIASISADNIINAEIDNEKSEDIVMSDNNTDNSTISNNNIDDATSGDGNTENRVTGEISTKDIPSPLLYVRETTDPSRAKHLKSIYLFRLSLQNLQ